MLRTCPQTPVAGAPAPLPMGLVALLRAVEQSSYPGQRGIAAHSVEVRGFQPMAGEAADVLLSDLPLGSAMERWGASLGGSCLMQEGSMGHSPLPCLHLFFRSPPVSQPDHRGRPRPLPSGTGP
jgi:hypothetical protein